MRLRCRRTSPQPVPLSILIIHWFARHFIRFSWELGEYCLQRGLSNLQGN
jgi:hypothetical protein